MKLERKVARLRRGWLATLVLGMGWLAVCMLVGLGVSMSAQEGRIVVGLGSGCAA